MTKPVPTLPEPRWPAEPRRLRGGWFESRGPAYVLARHWPPRFDIVAEAPFPPLRRGRLAQQVRQDLWREFRSMRGFSPVIEIDATKCGTMLTLRAGGRAIAPPPGTVDRIAALLADPENRARWIRCASVPAQGDRREATVRGFTPGLRGADGATRMAGATASAGADPGGTR